MERSKVCILLLQNPVKCLHCPQLNLDGHRTDKVEAYGEALPILEFAGAETKKRAPHLTHPHLCLEAIKYGLEHGGIAGLKKVQNLSKAAMDLDQDPSTTAGRLSNVAKSAQCGMKLDTNQ